jgi:hypothetical protein
VTPSDCRSSNHSVKTLVSCSCSIDLSLAFYRVGSIDRGELSRRMFGRRRVQLWNRFVEIEREIRRAARSLLIDESEQQAIYELRSRIASFRASILERRKTDARNATAIEDLRKLVIASQSALSA